MEGVSKAFLATTLVSTCRARCPNDYLNYQAGGLFNGNRCRTPGSSTNDPTSPLHDLDINDKRIEWHDQESPLKICALFDSQEKCRSRGSENDRGML